MPANITSFMDLIIPEKGNFLRTNVLPMGRNQLKLSSCTSGSKSFRKEISQEINGLSKLDMAERECKRSVVIEDVLEGDLVVPPNAKAIVIFAHGAGSSRHSSRNQYVAQTLNEAGFATLLVDLLTSEEKVIDEKTRHVRFDVDLLSRRFQFVTSWVQQYQETCHLQIGYFGSSTGAAAALIAAAKVRNAVRSIVSRGGRPDLVGDTTLSQVASPVLFIVGRNDSSIIAVTADAMKRLACSNQKTVAVIPGAGHLFEEKGKMEEVARVAANWFESTLGNEKPFESVYVQKSVGYLALREKLGLKLRFSDRAAAASMLASALRRYDNKDDVTVIGIPRGGVIIADVISKRLHSDFDIVFPRRLAAPENPEGAIGAMMQDGSVYLDEDIVQALNVSAEYLEMEKGRQRIEINRRLALYRPGARPYRISSRTVILADDGAATGSTIIAAARWIRGLKPHRLIIALPVAPKRIMPLLKKEADCVEALRTPSDFETVAQYYHNFEDITEEQVIQIAKSHWNS